MDREVSQLLAKQFPQYSPAVLFDVGANVGQSTQTMRSRFPDAEIFSFEPIKASFEMLSQKFHNAPRIRLENLAVGRSAGRAQMIARGTSEANAILRKQPNPKSTAPVQDVVVVSGSQYCADHNTGHIGYLKVDTEGFDMSVLLGFLSMLENHRIDFVQVEASMNPTNLKHVSFYAFLGLLTPLQYSLFRIVDQSYEMDGRPILRRANLIFISDEFANRNRPPS